MLNLSFDALILKFCTAVLALCYYAFYITILLLSDELKAVNADFIVFAGVILEHREENPHILDFHVFISFKRK